MVHEPSRATPTASPRLAWLAGTPVALAAGVLAVALLAHFLDWYAMLASAAVAVGWCWVTTGQPLKDLGLSWPGRPLRLLGVAAALALSLNLLGRMVLWPLLERLIGHPRDLSYLGPLRGNLPELLGLMPMIWLSAALCEEIVYRGFIQRRLERLFGDGPWSVVPAALLASTAFGLNHFVQGPSGMVITAVASMALGWIYRRSGHNLTLMVLIHGIWDTFSVVLLYLGWDQFSLF